MYFNKNIFYNQFLKLDINLLLVIIKIFVYNYYVIILLYFIFLCSQLQKLFLSCLNAQLTLLLKNFVIF